MSAELKNGKAPDAAPDPGDLKGKTFSVGPRIAYTRDVTNLQQNLLLIENLPGVQELRDYLKYHNEYLLIGPRSTDTADSTKLVEIQLALFSDGFQILKLDYGLKRELKEPKYIKSIGFIEKESILVDKELRFDTQTWSDRGKWLLKNGYYEDEYSNAAIVQKGWLGWLVRDGLSCDLVKTALKGRLKEIRAAAAPKDPKPGAHNESANAEPT